MSQQDPAAPQRRRGGPKWGWGLTVSGCGGLLVAALFIVAIGGGTLLPVFQPVREKARTAACLSNVKQMSRALRLYSQDYDGQLPRGAIWMDAAGRYRKPENWSHCPAVHPFSLSAFGYAFNSNLSGKKVTAIANPAATPMLYDSTNLARNASDPVTSLPEPPRHGAGNNLGYADGHARWSGHPATAPQPRPDGG